VVLSDLEATVGERELRGSIAPKKQAERRYEKAITDGDGAINLGNLLPGERATLRYQ
jgi:hypothetical protein